MAGRRDEQRAFLLKTRARRTKEFEFEGETFRVREPSLAERDAFIKHGKNIQETNALSEAELFCALTFVVDEDGGQMFTKADKDALAQQPIGFFDAVMAACQDLITMKEKDAKEIEKNSEGTPNES